MPQFETLYAELGDLAQDDPMRPAAIVHVLGSDARQCYDEISWQHSMYVIGRGSIPLAIGKPGYFFTASLPDYPVLKSALARYWPDMPDFPSSRGDVQLTTSQELADVHNYVARAPMPDSVIFQEARRHLRGLVPGPYIQSTALVAKWLVENMLPANNCFTLAAILARWLQEHGADATYCTGQAAFLGNSISHAWVEIKGEICDPTANHQSVWGNVGARRIRVNDSRIVYRATADADRDFWSVYSKPADRQPYTEASRQKQRQLIAELGISPERWAWVDHIWAGGIAEGTYRLLLDKFASPSREKERGRRRVRKRR
ncbi:MAG TPA: hypothetical protein ENN99_07285 [Chloroflexi bacterium]|nr:hypothetical protein [Chloroflexota bacterium]